MDRVGQSGLIPKKKPGKNHERKQEEKRRTEGSTQTESTGQRGRKQIRGEEHSLECSFGREHLAELKMQSRSREPWKDGLVEGKGGLAARSEGIAARSGGLATRNDSSRTPSPLSFLSAEKKTEKQKGNFFLTPWRMGMIEFGMARIIPSDSRWRHIIVRVESK